MQCAFSVVVDIMKCPGEHEIVCKFCEFGVEIILQDENVHNKKLL